jgi:hypothetical protein
MLCASVQHTYQSQVVIACAHGVHVCAHVCVSATALRCQAVSRSLGRTLRPVAQAWWWLLVSLPYGAASWLAGAAGGGASSAGSGAAGAVSWASLALSGAINRHAMVAASQWNERVGFA